MCVPINRYKQGTAWSWILDLLGLGVCSYKQVFRKNWMFRLVGTECFKIGKHSAMITITSSEMTFAYLLTIDGKSFKKFVAAQTKNTRVWLPELEMNSRHRVVLGE